MWSVTTFCRALLDEITALQRLKVGHACSEKYVENMLTKCITLNLFPMLRNRRGM